MQCDEIRDAFSRLAVSIELGGHEIERDLDPFAGPGRPPVEGLSCGNPPVASAAAFDDSQRAVPNQRGRRLIGVEGDRGCSAGSIVAWRRVRPAL